MVARLQGRKPPRGLLTPDRRRRRAFVVGLQDGVQVRVGAEHLHGPRRPRPGNPDQKEGSGVTSCRGTHRRSVPPGRRRRLSAPQTLRRIGSSAGSAAVIGARVPHAPTSLPERSKACRGAGYRAGVVCWSVMALNRGPRRAVRVGRARGGSVAVINRPHAPRSNMTGMSARVPRPLAVTCDSLRPATNTS